MRRDLSERSLAYGADAEIYDLFARREDADGLVLRHLLPLAKGARILDAGCGSGKYAELLAGAAASIDAQDRSAPLLALARRRCSGFGHVRFHKGDLTKDLPAGPFDLVLAAWVLGTLADAQRRASVLERLESRLASGGRIVLVENDEGGLFERLRGRESDPEQRTRRYNSWLEARGFRPTLRGETRFCFEDLVEARQAFGAIWGEEVGAAVDARDVPHRIIVFERRRLTPGQSDGDRPSAEPS